MSAKNLIDELPGRVTLSDHEIALLGDTDDDWYGLWEVDWFFDGAFGDWSRETRTALLLGLVERGLMEVFFGPLLTEQPPLAIDMALAALADPASWLPPSDGQTVGYYVSASAVGLAALRSQESEAR